MELAIHAAAIYGVPEAARRFAVPERTLRRKLQQRQDPDFQPHLGSSNAARVLNDALEHALLKELLQRADDFTPATAAEVKVLAAQLAEQFPPEGVAARRAAAKWAENGAAGEKWFRGFMKKYPELAQRLENKVEHARAVVTQEQLSPDAQQERDASQLLAISRPEAPAASVRGAAGGSRLMTAEQVRIEREAARAAKAAEVAAKEQRAAERVRRAAEKAAERARAEAAAVAAAAAKVSRQDLAWLQLVQCKVRMEEARRGYETVEEVAYRESAREARAARAKKLRALRGQSGPSAAI